MDNLEKIIKMSTFEILPGDFMYVKAARIPSSTHFLISQDSDEITVVTTTDRENEIEILEKNKEIYSLIALNVSVPFYSVGFLAKVSSTIAQKGFNILIVSTYSKDYILVKKSVINNVREELLKIGFSEKN